MDEATPQEEIGRKINGKQTENESDMNGKLMDMETHCYKWDMNGTQTENSRTMNETLTEHSRTTSGTLTEHERDMHGT